MAQISRRKIEDKDWERMWKKLVYVIKSNGDDKASEVLLVGLLTATERVMITKRLMVGVLALSDWKPVKISEAVRLSHATVYKLMAQLELSSDYRKLLRRLFPEQIEYKENKAAPMSFLDELDELIGDILDGRRHRSRLGY